MEAAPVGDVDDAGGLRQHLIDAPRRNPTITTRWPILRMRSCSRTWCGLAFSPGLSVRPRWLCRASRRCQCHAESACIRAIRRTAAADPSHLAHLAAQRLHAFDQVVLDVAFAGHCHAPADSRQAEGISRRQRSPRRWRGTHRGQGSASGSVRGGAARAGGSFRGVSSSGGAGFPPGGPSGTTGFRSPGGSCCNPQARERSHEGTGQAAVEAEHAAGADQTGGWSFPIFDEYQAITTIDFGHARSPGSPKGVSLQYPRAPVESKHNGEACLYLSTMGSSEAQASEGGTSHPGGAWLPDLAQLQGWLCAHLDRRRRGLNL